MKKFEYRLQSYLKYQSFERDKALTERNRAQDILQSFIDQDQRLEEQMRLAFLSQAKVEGNKRDLLLESNALFIRRLCIERENVQQEIHLARRDLERKQEKLIAMQKQVRSLEKHRDLQREQHREERLKIEQKKLDEMNQTRRRGGHAESL